MKTYETRDIRNICLMGHGGSGKTSLTEAMLYVSGCIDRMGRVSDGNTVSDYDPEEIRRRISISATSVPIEWKNVKINVIDTPGYFDFAGEAIQGLYGSDSALIVLSAKDGVEVGVEKSFRYAKNLGLPVAFFISKTDEENADFVSAFESLRKTFGSHVCPILVPVTEGKKVTGYADLVRGQFVTYDKSGKPSAGAVPAAAEEQFGEYSEMMREAICEESDELMDKFFSGEPFTAEETLGALRKGVRERKVFPVISGSAFMLEAVSGLLDALADYMPAPGDNGPAKAFDEDGAPVELPCDSSGPLCAYVFKTLADPFVGKMSFFKVISGTLRTNAALVNSRSGVSERFGHILIVRGKKNSETDTVSAGDIVAVTKLASASTGDTYCGDGRKLSFPPMELPRPSLSMAVIAKDKGDEEKVSSGLIKLMEEDPTFTFTANQETKQQILSGLGENHLDVLISKLKSKYGPTVELVAPKVPYRETIRGTAEAEGKHKKQSGGAGQFGVVNMRFEPLANGEDFEFVNAIVGGVVPKEYIPAVEKGTREAIQHGVLAGFPLIGVKATLYFGKYHPVDSKEIAFKSAARLAYKAAIPNAKPVLLEPIGHLSVTVPDANVGDVVGDINKRRGRMLGMGPAEGEPGYTTVEADVPMAPMFDYSIGLRSMTKARGSFEFAFDRYEDAPANVAQQVIAEYKSDEEDED